jgi:hypothetical protein
MVKTYNGADKGHGATRPIKLPVYKRDLHESETGKIREHTRHAQIRAMAESSFKPTVYSSGLKEF